MARLPPAAPAAVEPVPDDRVLTLWEEQRDLVSGTASSVATVFAAMVPSSGVGWVDLRHASLAPRRLPLPPQWKWQRRVLADWSGMTRPQVMRAVIKLADDWFEWCAEQVERERAVAALADPSKTEPQTMLPQTQREQLLRQMQQMQKAKSPSAPLEGTDALCDLLGWEADPFGL